MKYVFFYKQTKQEQTKKMQKVLDLISVFYVPKQTQ